MEDDIFESISQRSDDAQDSENKRILAIANELHRRCKLYEEKLRDGKENGSWIDIEQCVVEQYEVVSVTFDTTSLVLCITSARRSPLRGLGAFRTVRDHTML